MQNNQMNPLEQGAPWLANYGDVPFHLEYPNVSIADAVLKTAEKEKDFPAISFMGKTFSYTVLVEKINQAAAGFVALGVKKGDMVTICMPNVPQAVFCMYALNRIGAVASMIHPLSAVSEIIYYLKEVKSDYLLTLDQFYSKVAEVEKTYPVKKVIITSAADELGAVKSAAFRLMNAKKNKVNKADASVIFWKDFIGNGKKVDLAKYIVHMPANETAVILFSGGTTGVTKGIQLSGMNFNALGLQTAAMCNSVVRHARMLAAMPIFHGFGLGVCIHTMLEVGGTSILVPQFNVKKYAELIKKAMPLQGGFRGYPMPPALVLITGDNQTMMNQDERNECYTDGGLFGMSLLLALEEQQIAACPLNTMLPMKRDEATRELLHIPDSEFLVMYIAVGHFRDEVKTCKSQRFSADEIVTVHA